MLYPTVKNTLTGRIAFPALDALREGYDVYPVVDAIAGTSVEAHRAGLERRAVLVGLSALVLASDVIGGIVYDATGPGGALIVAALGALTLLGRAGAAISSPPAGFGDLAREWWSRKGRTTNTLKLPFAAIPRPRPERKELLYPTQL